MLDAGKASKPFIARRRTARKGDDPPRKLQLAVGSVWTAIFCGVAGAFDWLI